MTSFRTARRKDPNSPRTLHRSSLMHSNMYTGQALYYKSFVSLQCLHFCKCIFELPFFFFFRSVSFNIWIYVYVSWISLSCLKHMCLLCLVFSSPETARTAVRNSWVEFCPSGRRELCMRTTCWISSHKSYVSSQNADLYLQRSCSFQQLANRTIRGFQKYQNFELFRYQLFKTVWSLLFSL